MSRKTRKLFIITGIICVGLFVMYQAAKMMAPGSYVYAKSYQLDAPENKVIEAVKMFKKRHPEMVDPDSNLIESEGRRDSSYWYFIYLYYPKEEQTVLAWTRPTVDSLNTELAFVSINDGSGWKQINKDFSGDDNKKLKAQFEQRFVKALGIRYSDKG